MLPILLVAPVSAQVDPAVHKLCVDAKDYSGCVQTQLSLSKKAKSEPAPVTISDPTELTARQEHLNENPSLKAWVKANPTLGAKKREEWEELEEKNQASYYQNDDDQQELACLQKGSNFSWDGYDCNYTVGTGRSATVGNNQSQYSQCPPGKQMYRTKGLFGLGARDLGCMTAYEAESLNRQTLQSIQNNLQNNLNRTNNCTTSFIGNTAYTNCY